MINLSRAYRLRTPPAESVLQTWEQSTGTGSLDGARGSQRLVHDGVVLDGERDIFGNPWDGVSGRSWSNAEWGL